MVAAKLATLKWGRPAKDEKEENFPLSLKEASDRFSVSDKTIKHARAVENGQREGPHSPLPATRPALSSFDHEPIRAKFR